MAPPVSSPKSALVGSVSPKRKLLNARKKIQTYNLLVPPELRAAASPRSRSNEKGPKGRNGSVEPPTGSDPQITQERDELRKNCADIRAEYQMFKGNILQERQLVDRERHQRFMIYMDD